MMIKQLLNLAVSHVFQSKLFKDSLKHSTFTKIVYTLLQAGAQLDDSYADFNQSTAHLKPITLMKSDTHILKMLMAAGAELKETILFEWDESLQDLSRKSIRKQLKQFNPESNLYATIPQLALPHRMQAYLLFYTQEEVQTNLKKEEKELLYRTMKTDVEFVVNLIQSGEDVNVQDKKGMTPLMFASQVGHVELVKKLIEAGANMNIQANSGDTALIYATKESRIKCVQKFIEFGANVNLQGRNGQTALMNASAVENLNIDKLDIPPLHLAAREGHINCVKELIRAGADLNTVDVYGNTPLMAAAQNFSFVCVSTLLKAGADFDTTYLALLAMMTSVIPFLDSEGTVHNTYCKTM